MHTNEEATRLQATAKKLGFDPRRDDCPLCPEGTRFRMDCTHSLKEALLALAAQEESNDQSD